MKLTSAAVEQLVKSIAADSGQRIGRPQYARAEKTRALYAVARREFPDASPQAIYEAVAASVGRGAKPSDVKRIIERRVGRGAPRGPSKLSRKLMAIRNYALELAEAGKGVIARELLDIIDG